MTNSPHLSIDERLRLAREEQEDAFAALAARIAWASEVMEGPNDCSAPDLAVAAETLAIYGDVVRASRAEEVLRVLGRARCAKAAVDAQWEASRGRFGMLTVEHVLWVLIFLTLSYVAIGITVGLAEKVFN